MLIVLGLMAMWQGVLQPLQMLPLTAFHTLNARIASYGGLMESRVGDSLQMHPVNTSHSLPYSGVNINTVECRQVSAVEGAQTPRTLRIHNSSDQHTRLIGRHATRGDAVINPGDETLTLLPHGSLSFAQRARTLLCRQAESANDLLSDGRSYTLASWEIRRDAAER